MAPRITRDPQIEANREPSQVEETSLSTAPSLPASELSFHPAPSNDNVDALLKDIPRARSYRGVLTVLSAICIGVAASVAWHSYGEEAKQRLSSLIPHLSMEAPAPAQAVNAVEAQDTATQAAAPQPNAEVEPAQETATAAQPSTPTPSTDPVTPPTQAAPTQAALPAEIAQSLEANASEIAALKSAVEDLKASQQQLRREIATAAEREAHPKPPVQHRAKSVPPRPQRPSPQAATYNPPLPSPSPPPATESRIPAQRDAYIPSQAPVPARLPAQPGDDSAPRPPMPVR
ncbi:hypothetical protein [Nitrobacter sp. TKz-YC02]|uniref:hypothetical protein n=1 Tax=Nitrobacter sp. TKz-YC02 TaxID=3398704 RepID=UPI003CED1044